MNMGKCIAWAEKAAQHSVHCCSCFSHFIFHHGNDIYSQTTGLHGNLMNVPRYLYMYIYIFNFSIFSRNSHFSLESSWLEALKTLYQQHFIIQKPELPLSSASSQHYLVYTMARIQSFQLHVHHLVQVKISLRYLSGRYYSSAAVPTWSGLLF